LSQIIVKYVTRYLDPPDGGIRTKAGCEKRIKIEILKLKRELGREHG